MYQQLNNYFGKRCKKSFVSARKELSVTDSDPVSDIMKTNASDLLIGAFVWNEPYVQYIMRKVAPYKRVVIGGPQVSYVGTGELEKYYPNAHAFIRGYAEQATVESFNP